MRNTFRKNDGFTLMELMLTIAVGSIVTLAAVTVLLMGLRINKQAMDTASRQSTTRILISALEDMATEGTITDVDSDDDTWKIYGENNLILFSYDFASQTIYSGNKKAALMEGVISSKVSLDNQLLTIKVMTEDGSYTSSVYCRMVIAEDTVQELLKPEKNDDSTEQSETKLNVKFLELLASQYARKSGSLTLRNNGLILENGVSTGTYFSEWYSGSQWGSNGWGPNTPWCACFISWGLYETMYETGCDITRIPRYANVDNFMGYFVPDNQEGNSNGDKWKYSKYYKGTCDPQPGDLIFFDWKINNDLNPEHIGAVIKADDEYVYTIEGNSSNRVAVRKYKIDDPRIIGYGVINWSKTK